MVTVTSNQLGDVEDRRTIVAGSAAKLSWGALFGAAFVVLGLFLLLMSIGLAVGLSSIDPDDPSSARPAGMGIGIWSVISSLVALFIGGLFASRTAGVVDRAVGAIHGAVLWGLQTALTVFLLFAAARGIGSGLAQLGSSVVGAGGGMIERTTEGGDPMLAALGIGTEDLVGSINQQLRAEGKPTVSADEVRASVRDVVQTAIIEGRLDRELFVSSLTENTRMSRDGARDIVTRVEQSWSERRESMMSSAGTALLRAADQTGDAMWWTFLGLALGLGSAVLGGVVGVSRRQRRAARAEVPLATTREAIP